MDLYTQYAVVAAKEAVTDAGIDVEKEDLNKVGVILGVGIGGIHTFEEEVAGYERLKKRPRTEIQSVLYSENDCRYCIRTDFYHVWLPRT